MFSFNLPESFRVFYVSVHFFSSTYLNQKPKMNSKSLAKLYCDNENTPMTLYLNFSNAHSIRVDGLGKVQCAYQYKWRANGVMFLVHKSVAENYCYFCWIIICYDDECVCFCLYYINRIVSSFMASEVNTTHRICWKYFRYNSFTWNGFKLFQMHVYGMRTFRFCVYI